jgi:hypothetical protein
MGSIGIFFSQVGKINSIASVILYAIVATLLVL